MKEFESKSANLKIPKGHSMASVKLYFWIGIISAILLRTILITGHYNSLISYLMWYMGVIGYLIFFAHRYDIAKRRYGTIKNSGLLEKIEMRQSLTDEDFDGLDYVMWSLSVSKDREPFLRYSYFRLPQFCCL